jgi:hypothetical protein
MAPAPRLLDVGAARLERWLAGFVERHGAAAVTAGPAGPVAVAHDGARAEFSHPWADPAVADVAALAAAVLAPRAVGVLLVRRGGYACAVVRSGQVVASKVGSRYVQGRTAAGGWSQQRFARRRANQADELAGAAADVAARVLVAAAPSRLATGGDRPLVDRVLADPRLHALAGLPRGPHLQVGDPRADVVKALPDRLTRVSITLVEPVVPAHGQETTARP